VPADASSLIPPALDPLREHPGRPGVVPGLLERLSGIPDPREPLGVRRHTLAVVLALTACAVLTRATSLPAVGEWITEAPKHVLDQLGAPS
jgi:hypothetical protein